MHADLELIVALWDLDHRVDTAKGRAAALKAVVTQADQRIAELTDTLADLANQIADKVRQEAEVQVELDKYIMRTKRSRDLLDGHQVVDFLTVEKQLEQCAAHVLELEEKLLGIMTVRESLQDEVSATEASREDTREAKGQAHAQWVSEGREIRSQLESLWPDRQAAAELLNRDLMKRYTGFRVKKLVPVCSVKAKFCTACNVLVQDQMRLEVRSGRRIHTCRGCGRWILPRTKEDETDVAEEQEDE